MEDFAKGITQMTRRLSYIDTTRAILITMVVLGHILNYANPGYDIIPYTLAQAFMNSFHTICPRSSCCPEC